MRTPLARCGLALALLLAACSDYKVGGGADDTGEGVAGQDGGADGGGSDGGSSDGGSGDGGSGDGGGTMPGAPECTDDYDEATLLTVDSYSGRVYTVDPGSAALTELSTLSAYDAASNFNSSAFRADGLAVVSDSGLNRLLLLDPCTGALTVLGDTGVGNLCGISWGPGGLLFGLDNEGDQLVLLNPLTGAGAPIGSLGFDLGTCGLSWDCVSGMLIGVDGGTGSLFAIDPATGGTATLRDVALAVGVGGAEFDPRDQTLILTEGTGLAVVDLVSGAATWRGDFGVTGNWDDLAFLTAPLDCD